MVDLHQLRLAWVDRKGTFTDEDKALLPGLHFCPEWDFQAICDSSPEIEGCTCGVPLPAKEEGRD